MHWKKLKSSNALNIYPQIETEQTQQSHLEKRKQGHPEEGKFDPHTSEVLLLQFNALFFDLFFEI